VSSDDNDIGHTETEVAGKAIVVDKSPHAPADIESDARDLAQLPTIDPETYVYGYQFARGGMGRIAAVRDRRLGRVLAIKELLSQDPVLVQRFQREIQITARLQHPAIVSVIEAGRWPSGEPFFAMKRVVGQSLKDAIEARPTLDDRLGLVPNVIAIADALAYAHQQRIVHRDLKPANVLVGEFGETVVIDWGLAKDLRADVADDTLPVKAEHGSGSVTIAGSVLGTPAYMAPEQAKGGAIDERTDVYALGALLYTVLVGNPPYDGTPTKILELVLAEPPARVADRQPGVPPDLQAIVERAMSRDPEARYPTALELAADLKRFTTGRLVSAHRYSRAQLFARWVRRHRGAVVVGAAAFVTMAVLGVVGVTRILDERDRALVAEDASARRADALLVAQARAVVEQQPLAALRALGELELDSTQWPAARLIAADAAARGLPTRVLALPPGTDEEALSPDGKQLAFADKTGQLHLRDVATGQTRSVGARGGAITDIAFSDDGKTIAAANIDNTATVYDANGDRLHTLRGHDGWVVGITVTPVHILTASYDNTTRVWTRGGEPVSVIPRALPVRQVSDTGWLLGLETTTTSVWKLADGAQILDKLCACATLAPIGNQIATADDATVIVRELPSGTPRELGTAGARVSELVYSRDAKLVAALTHAGTVTVFEITSGKNWTYRGLGERVFSAAFSPANAWLAAWTAGGAVHLIDLAARDGRVLHGTAGPARFTSDAEVITRDPEKRFLAWSTQPGGARVIAGGGGIAISPDGKLLASGMRGWALRLTELATGTHRDLAGHDANVLAIAFSPNGALLAAIDANKRVRLWDVAAGKSVLLPGRAIRSIAFAPDGRTIAAPGDQQSVRVWDVTTGAIRDFAGHAGGVVEIAFAPDGKQLASAGIDGTVRIWEIASGAGRVLGAHEGATRGLVFAPDGSWIATAGEDATIRVWSLRGGATRILRGHTGWVSAIAVAPDGTLASGGVDRTVRIWNGDTSTELGKHVEAVLYVTFGDDGATLASTSVDGTARLWDLATRDHRLLSGHRSPVIAARLAANRIVTATMDGVVRVWPDDLPREAAALRAWLERAIAGR
jgi:WD40 repeat protein